MSSTLSVEGLVVDRPIVHIPLEQIAPKPDQPRKYFSEKSLIRLGNSMKRKGQLVPVKVRRITSDPQGRPFELDDGERRSKAAKLAGLLTLRAEIVDPLANDYEHFESSVVANFGRDNHTPMEVVDACRRMREHRTIEEIAELITMSVASVNNYLRLTYLHPELQAMLDPELPPAERLHVTVAITLCALNPQLQLETFAKLKQAKIGKKRKISVRDAMVAVKSTLNENPAARSEHVGERRRTPVDDRRVFTATVHRIREAVHNLTETDPRELLPGYQAGERAELKTALEEARDELNKLLRTFSSAADSAE